MKSQKNDRKEKIERPDEETLKAESATGNAEALKEALQRLQAEFENYKKRVFKEQTALKEATICSMLREMLPLLDSFDQAMNSTKNHEAFIKGVELVYAQLKTFLEREGLKPIAALGKKFNPYIHEVLMREPNSKEAMTIIEEFQKGYLFKDKVLRTSKVKLSSDDISENISEKKINKKKECANRAWEQNENS